MKSGIVPGRSSSICAKRNSGPFSERAQLADAKLATTNRELAVLRRAFRLARKRGVSIVIPDIETPKEENIEMP